MSTYTFTIPGMPVGKERPRKGKYGFYTPAKTKAYEEQVQLFLREECPEIEPTLNICYLDIKWRKRSDGEEELEVNLHQTDDLPPRERKRPDGDNIQKIVADALNGIAYHDDSQIWWWSFQREKG